MADLHVELLAVEECPHLESALHDLESVLRRGIIEVPIQVVFVSSQDDAEFLGFQGSPTIRINGDDIVPQPDLPVALGCRLYRDDAGKTLGSPPIESIRAAVDAHRRGRLEEFQREEAAKVAEFARAADASDPAGAAPAPAAETVELGRRAKPTESSTGSKGEPQEG